MTLTLANGPLSGRATETVNYRIDGPPHRLLFEPFPRRVRALLAGEVVLDTRQGCLLHETGILPQLYVPSEDAQHDLLQPTDHHTHCPFKGDASYWSAQVGDRRADNAIWSYPEPVEGAAWLGGYVACYWDAMDAWFDEDEQVHGHLRDPYHRVDVRATSRRVRVLVDEVVVADSTRPKLLSETGLPNRYYLPPADVRGDLLEPSASQAVCPYKGTASYRTLTVGGRRIDDAAWYYDDPLENALKARGHLCFDGAGITVEVDGEIAE